MRDYVCYEGEVAWGVDLGDDDCGEVGRFALHVDLSQSFVEVFRKRVLTTSIKSANASPLDTELIRTARSLIPSGCGWSIACLTSLRASSLREGVTLSSRS